ncbi:MAG: hypothetical protein KDE63_07950 [Novosphingobium sp.]|nr:hypothetical protein [Novosphingobium sp.]
MNPDLSKISFRLYNHEVVNPDDPNYDLYESSYPVHGFGKEIRLVTMPNGYWKTLDKAVNQDQVVTCEQIYEDICRVNNDDDSDFDFSLRAWIDAYRTGYYR